MANNLNNTYSTNITHNTFSANNTNNTNNTYNTNGIYNANDISAIYPNNSNVIHKKRVASYTIVELMLVVTIIGILSVVATPFFKEYLIRTKVANAIAIGANMQQAVIDYYNLHGSLPPDCPGSGDFADVTDPSTTVSIIRWCNGDGYPPVYYRVEIWLKSIDSTVNNRSIFLTVDANALSNGLNVIRWICGTHYDGSTQLPCSVLPSSCQLNCS